MILLITLSVFLFFKQIVTKRPQLHFQILDVFSQSRLSLQVDASCLRQSLAFTLKQKLVHAHVRPILVELEEEPRAHHHVERLEHPSHRFNCVPIPNAVDRDAHAGQLAEAAHEAQAD